MFYFNKPNFIEEIFFKWLFFCIFATMIVKTKAVILHSFRYGEASVIVDTFTETNGRLSFIVKISRSQKSKFKKQYFQPLHIIDMEFDYRPRVSLQRMKDVRIAYPFVSIPFDPYKLSISMFIAEFLCRITSSEQCNEALFNYIQNSVLWLDGVQSSFSNFHLVFMMRLTRFIGFYPNLDNYSDGDYFDLRNGCFVSRLPLHPDVLQPEEAKKIALMMRMDYETMHLFAMSRQERTRCIEVIIMFYRLHVPSFPELKSLPVLKELFV
jgi:DNA repair protein RecO (recombination protein O)